MRNILPLYLALASVVLLAGLHFIAGTFYLYWTVGWFDYLMHFLGGFGGGFVVVWFISNKNLSGVQIAIITFVSVMIVGVAWEIFEYVNGIAQSTEGYRADTFHDLLMDALGSLTAVLVSLKQFIYDRN